MANKPILCVDWDGVIHSYTSGWKGAAVIPDPPVPGALRWLLDASKLFSVVIYSSRSKEPEGINAMRQWLQMHAVRDKDIARLEVDTLMRVVRFAHEKPSAYLTVDDRCVCFDGDFTKLDPNKLLQFKPWNHAPSSERRDALA